VDRGSTVKTLMKVTMYAQWRTIEDYEAMRKNPAPAPYLQEALTIAKFEPGMYEVVESYFPADGCEGGRAARLCPR
jgi:hypothetical protein